MKYPTNSSLKVLTTATNWLAKSVTHYWVIDFHTHSNGTD